MNHHLKMRHAQGPSHKAQAAVYLRVASGSDEDQRAALAAQRAACSAEAARLGAVVTHEYIDTGASGTGLNRPGLGALLEALEGGDIELVVTESLARLSRSQADTAVLVERFAAAGAVLFAANQQLALTPGSAAR